MHNVLNSHLQPSFFVKGRASDDGCWKKLNRRLADFVLTTDEDKLAYLKQYNCNPPPLFILIVSLAEVEACFLAVRTVSDMHVQLF